MTINLKAIKTLIFVLALACLYSCTPEDGRDGEQGIAGNANVKQYNFGSATFSQLHTYKIENFTQKDFDESIFIAYHEISTLPNVWFVTPGFGYLSNYQTKVNMARNDSTLWFNVLLTNEDGTPHNQNITFSKFKIFVVPASLQTSAQGKNVKNMDYKELTSYLNLQKKQ